MFDRVFNRKRKYPFDPGNQSVVSSYASSAAVLPDDLILMVASKLTLPDVASLSTSCKLFNTPLKNQLAVRKLVQHVTYGKQDEAENMLKINPGLASVKADVTDYSERKFKKISAIQYAAWALDTHMLRMLLRYVPDNKEAWDQLNDLEKNGTMIVTQKKDRGIQVQKQDGSEEKSEIAGKLKETSIEEKSSNYDFSPLVAALQTYVDNYEGRNYQENKYYWCKQVGGAQRNMPAHVANEYCHPYRSLVPTPSFKEKKLPRSFDFQYCKPDRPYGTYVTGQVFSNVGAGNLGYSFALYRGMGKLHSGFMFSKRAIPPENNYQYLGGAGCGLEAIEALCKVRTLELTEIKQRLLKPTQEIESSAKNKYCVIS